MKNILMKNLRKSSIKISLAAAIFAIAIIFPTISWYSPTTISNINVEGNVHGSYFESGEGTTEKPFEIRRPIQLYYLAWLQEMGYFNETVSENGVLKLKQQYSFYLSSDIDMLIDPDEIPGNGDEYYYELPPIGTARYPFVGSFDGKGHVIKNLHVLNDASEYTNDPKDPKKEGNPSTAYEILGMFGVLGTTLTGEDKNKVTCSEVIDGEISELVGTYVPYDKDINYVTNFFLQDVLITASDTTEALVGVVAGYANAPITNVGIITSSFSIGGVTSSPISDAIGTVNTSVLSKYLSIGYAEAGFVRNISTIDEYIYNPQARTKKYISNSAGNSWGGSVNFAAMRARVANSRYMGRSVADNKLEAYPIRETYVNGTRTGHKDDTTIANALNGQNQQNSEFYYSDTVASGFNSLNNKTQLNTNTIGKYHYVYQESGKKAYLGGMTDVGASTVKEVTRITQNDQNEQCYYIRTGTNNTYVGIDGSGVITTNNSKANGKLWHFNNNQLYCRHTTSDGVESIFFLNSENNGFKIERTSNTEWTKNSNTFKAKSLNKYRIKSGSNYLINSGSTGIDKTNQQNNAIYWNLENSDSSEGAISYTISGNTYYLNISPTNGSSSNNTTGLYLYRGSYANWHKDTVNGGYNIYIVENGKTKDSKVYLTYNNNFQHNTSKSTIVLEKDNTTPSINFDTDQTYYDTAFSFEISQERSGQPGYVPLSAVGDTKGESAYKSTTNGTSITDYYTADMNTGYLVGGFYDKYNGDNTSQLCGYYFGDVRVSQYEKTRINNSVTFTEKTDDSGSKYYQANWSNIYTIDDTCYTDGNQNSTPKSFTQNSATAQNFVKFSSSLNSLNSILSKDKTYVSGVHFMNSYITMDRIITADKVYINGEIIPNFEMPEDSFDFNLKEKGYINFFAGNYHNDNNSFFALHKIERDENNKILSMKKIKYIFECTNDKNSPYIYLYSDNTWSDGSNRSASKADFNDNQKSYTCKFDTKWIDKNETLIPKYNANGSTKRVYYFEIPVNEGEYALGSSQDTCGAYIIYLDIGAAAQSINRNEVNECIIKDSLTAEIPYGIQYVSSLPDLLTDWQYSDETKMLDVRSTAGIDDRATYVGELTVDANGNYVISKSTVNNVSTIYVTESPPGINTVYIGDNLVLSGSPPADKNRTITRRITDYDENTVTGIYVTQVTEIVTEVVSQSGNDNINTARTTISYNSTGFNDSNTLAAVFSYSWTGASPNFAYSYYLAVFGGGGRVEANFQNPNNDNFILNVEQLGEGFVITTGENTNEISYTDLSTGTKTLQIPKTTEDDDFEADTWVDLTTDQINHIHYILEADESIEETYSFATPNIFNSTVESDYGDNYTTIQISGNKYNYLLILSGAIPVPSENVHFYVWYTAQTNTITISYGDGQTIDFVQTSEGVWMPTNTNSN